MERAFLYGDLLFESMRAEHGRIPHLSRHFRRLSHSAQILKLDLCGLNEEKFNTICEENLEAFSAKHPDSPFLRVRAVLQRDSAGTYLPDQNLSKLSIQIAEIPTSVQPEILRLGLYTEQAKAPGPLANIKTGNALLYVMASIWAKEKNLDGALILNTQNHLIESTHSNIFWRLGSNWFTPPLSDGCIAGIGRELFMESRLVTEQSCTMNDLLYAEECLLSNALFAPRNFKLLHPL